MKFDTQDILRLLHSHPGRRHQADAVAIDLAYELQVPLTELPAFKTLVAFHLEQFLEKGLIDHGRDGYSLIDPFEEEADHG